MAGKVSETSSVFAIFRLCQIVTLLCAFLFIFNDSRREPLQCLVQGKNRKAIQTYCYISGLFTFQTNGSIVEMYSGFGNSMEDETPKIYHNYFFWMPYCLLVQGLLLSWPIHVWHSLGLRTIEGLVVNTNDIILSKKSLRQVEASARYFCDTLGFFNTRPKQYLVCELVAIMMLIANVFFIDWSVNGRFTHELPTHVMSVFSMDTDSDYMDRVFPKVAKCSFWSYGSSGGFNQDDILCVLGRNLITSHVYLFLFFIYFGCLPLALLMLVWDFVVFFRPSLRSWLLLRQMPPDLSCYEDLKIVLKHCSVGDWFVIKQIQSNSVFFNAWIRCVRLRITGEEDILPIQRTNRRWKA